ncbi:DUF6538 domain-containing protein [Antarctobacter sp.]|uniref:DUF6538 domain-containing protein n=1 Tax=Antarctobacter sp. TaxID=1872577 RepID=UPI003A93389A
MPVYLRGSTYHLKRRVPTRYAKVERRQFVYMSLKTDSLTVAQRKAEDVWDQLLAQWEALLKGDTNLAKVRYEAAQDLAKARQLRFMPAEEVAKLPLPEIVERVEMSVGPDGKINDQKGEAFLGAIEKPGLTMTECLEIFFELDKEEAARRSPNQNRVRANNFKRAIRNFITVVGDVEIQQLSRDHMMELRESFWLRVQAGEVSLTTANKEMKVFGTVLRRVNEMTMLGLDLPLKKLAFRGAEETTRKPFSTTWIKRTLIDGDHLDGLNAEARAIVRLIINTGLRPSEACGLLEDEICLASPIPHIEIKPREGGDRVRAVKTRSARRTLPLVGVSLAAAREFPKGFPRYYDKPGLSATVNKYLRERGLMETPEHSLYCLRHSFEDRMLMEGIDERLRRDFLGHRLDRERYGSGGDLDFRQRELKKIAL